MGNYRKILKQFALLKCKKNSKEPATYRGLHDAEVNADYTKWINEGYNIGISCAKSGLIVLDLDVNAEKGKNGFKTIEELEKLYGKLPKTLTQQTVNNGVHLFYKSNGVVNPKGKLAKDVDIRFNAYVLCEPSQINQKHYKFLNDVTEIAELPQKWLDFINKSCHISSNTSKNNSFTYERKVIDGDFQKMYNSCAFIKKCVDEAQTLSEIEWFYFGCVLNSLKNGLELFDYYSRVYPEYNKNLTFKKFNNAKKYNITCKTISGVCEKCKKCQKEEK